MGGPGLHGDAGFYMNAVQVNLRYKNKKNVRRPWAMDSTRYVIANAEHPLLTQNSMNLRLFRWNSHSASPEPASPE